MSINAYDGQHLDSIIETHPLKLTADETALRKGAVQWSVVAVGSAPDLSKTPEHLTMFAVTGPSVWENMHAASGVCKGLPRIST